MLLKRKIEIEIRHDNSSIYIYAYCKNREVGRIGCTIIEGNKQVKIDDITCTKNNKGYGSLMMMKLIKFAKENGFQSIIGFLACVDRGHEKRLYHFYQKFGFEITPNDEGMKFADIRLNL